MASNAVRAASSLWLAILLAGCGVGGPATFVWTEDVQLADGSVIQVHREVHYSDTTKPMGGPPSAILGESVVQIVSPDIAQSVPWRMRLQANHIDKNLETGQWIILGDFSNVNSASGETCDFWLKYGRLETPEVAFALQNGSWVQVTVPRTFFGRKVNLISGVPRERIPTVSLEKKLQWYAQNVDWDSVHSDLQISRGQSLPLQCERTLRAQGKL